MKKYELMISDIVDSNYNKKLKQPVMYLSRMLNKHEVNYWLTELKITRIVWAIQKTCHLIKSCTTIKVFTDYSSIVDVLNSHSLKTSSSVRQNLRHICASQFIS